MRTEDGSVDIVESSSANFRVIFISRSAASLESYFAHVAEASGREVTDRQICEIESNYYLVRVSSTF
jgi:hypothetical protein